jgi:hypothetical protein
MTSGCFASRSSTLRIHVRSGSHRLDSGSVVLWKRLVPLHPGGVVSLLAQEIKQPFSVLTVSIGATSAIPAFSSIAIISMSTSSSSITSSPTGPMFSPVPSLRGNTWIAGVVVGPFIGIAMGAALMWFCLRKRKNKKAQQDQAVEYVQGGHHQE